MQRSILVIFVLCLASIQAIAQSNTIQKLPKTPAQNFRKLAPRPLHHPQKGPLTQEGISLDKMPAQNARQASVHSLAQGQIQMPSQEALRHAPNGNLLSVDGFEVEFKVPNNAGGNCATPIPEVLIPPTASMPANCPFVVPCDIAANRDAAIPQPADPIKFMKLNWIVVRDGAGTPSSNIDQNRIDQLMTEANADFLPFRIQFCADPATFVNDATHYSLNAGTEDGSLKTTYGSTPQNWINVYVVGSITNPSAGGYARFPYDPFGGTNIRGGLVLARGNMFLGTHTVAHELGHTFGLHHTFHGVDEVTACSNCYEDMGLAGQDTEGDWCSDTRPHPTNANICGDAGTDACTGIPFTGAPVNNHMSYSFCTSQFTPQQAGRMHCMIDSYLSSWVAYGGSTCGGLPPVADFSGTPTLWQAPMTVNYTDLSVPSPTILTWTWNFDVTGIGGVTPATFSGGPGVGDNPPPVTYTICDTSYTVSLTVTNSNGSDTETKVNYIRATCPAGDCDTLFSHWNTPTSTPSIYTFGANDFVTGIPAPTYQGAGSIAPIGFYERYITPNPGVTTVGAVRVGLGNYVDPDSNTVIQVVVYNCTAAGVPIGAPLGGFGPINPGQDLGVPGAGFFNDFWIPFDKVTIPGASFLVGVEVFPGNSTDRLVIVSSAAGQGQLLGLNYVETNNFGYLNYRTDVGIDFDLDIIPMLGPWPTEFFLTGLGALQSCDTTLVLLSDSALFHPCMTGVTVTSSKLGSISDSLLANVDTLGFLYTSPGPDTIQFASVNMCGRTDTIRYILNYPYDTTPGPIDVVMNLTNPICAGTPITFTGSPTGAANYFWDFGDGSVASSGASNTTSHTYTTPGLYYVALTVTNASGCFAGTTKLDFVEIIDCSVNAPVAAFDANPDSLCLGDPFTFTDASLAVPDPATSWYWAFDDGTFSIQQNPTHTYAAPGTYNVMMVASNSGGNDTAYFTVKVLALPCLLPPSIHLSASGMDDKVALNWEASQGISYGEFEIRRSQDGSNFVTIGTLPESSGLNGRYGFLDDAPQLQGNNYYRIRSTSTNGELQYSNVVLVNLAHLQDAMLQIYPNPLTGDRLLNVHLLSEEMENLNWGLYDMLGRSLKTGSWELMVGENSFEMDLAGLAKGSYVVRLQFAGNTIHHRLILE